jgi:hypothetical protein
MSFASESGYTPLTIETIMDAVMDGVNTQFGTTYTTETFIGTNFYKYFYALVQRMQENEIKTSEIFLQLQDYFATTNERISRPVVTNPGLIEAIEDYGYDCSVKEPIDADAGKIYICVDILADMVGYADAKADIAEIIKNSTVAGAVTQGAESTSIVLTNGQSFAFKYGLPTRYSVLLKLTITLSENNQVVVGNPDDVKLALIANIEADYRLGKNFEPQRYFTSEDAPWAESILLEWSNDAGANYHSTVYDSAYNVIFDVLLENITLIEA